MLENYEEDKNGLIFQIEKNKINYDVNYINNSYNNYGPKVDNMSHLRYGFMSGVIQEKINSILDVGYGNGSFLNICKKNINECYGTDISGYEIPKDCTFLDIDKIYNCYFDVVCFFDSLEHFDDVYFLEKLNCSYIYISLPECHYLSDEWFMGWKHRRENEHLWHFNREGMKKFMEEQGYELICYSNIEDIIRTPIDLLPNILTGIFKKIK
jgi:SAM-dependent methyltransferase